MAGALRHGAILQCQDAAPRTQMGEGGHAHHKMVLKVFSSPDDFMILHTMVASTGRMETGWYAWLNGGIW